LRANNSQTQHHLSQTDKNSIRNGQHSKNSINQSKTHSNKSSNNGYAQNGHRYSEPIILKNGRSSSLPLKIMLNGTKSCHNLSSTTEKPIKSWSGTSSFFDNKTSERFSPNSLYLTYKYAQLSLSEHFLNLIEEEHKKTFLSNFSQSKLFELKNKLKKTNSIELDEDLSDHHSSSHSSSIEKSHLVENSETNSDESVTNSVEKLDMEQNGFKVQKVNSNHNLNLLRDESNCNESEKKNLANGHLSDSNNNVLDEINLNRAEIHPTKSSNLENNSSRADGNHLAEEASAEPNPPESPLTSMQRNENSPNSNHNNDLLVCVSEPESCEKKSSNDENENENDATMVSSSDANCNALDALETLSESGVGVDTSSSADNDTINNSLLSSDMSTLDEHSSSVKFEVDELTDESTQPLAELESLCGDDEDMFRNFLPKKSCLVQKSKLFIDTSSANSSEESCSMLMDSTANATSSPLIPTSPLSPSDNLSSSISSSFSSGSPTQSALSNSSASSSSSKKKVSFADVCGKELFSVRTMSEPSNCPPKLTSKIVQYFLNREYSSSSSNMNGNGLYCRSNSSDFGYFAGSGNNGYQKDSFFSASRNYDYGISAVNYTNDVNQLTGSIAVYTLNFAQPAGDYLKFRRKIEENNVSLENVLLNKFQINGTVKVKNIHFHKNVFVRCSFNGWQTFEDYAAQFVPCEFYTSSFASAASASATFFGSNHAAYQPNHKEYDTFRFEFQLPKTVDQYSMNANQSDPNASIQFCICYKSGASHEAREFWDSNDGKNYEILQYVMDIERLKSLNQPQAATNQLRSKKKETGTKFSYNSAQESITGVYY
jgi:protein phosphatase 1 regulatory subunit 3A/B/C/D/E